MEEKENLMQDVCTEVSPEVAAKWLSSALANRSISPAVVNRYACDMTQGRWEVNGETVKFSGKIGEGLVDGRHRLAACVQSGASFKTYVVTGISNFSEIDIGRRRSLADGVRIFGSGLNLSFSMALDGAVNLLVCYARESSAPSSRIVSHRQKLEFTLNNQVMKRILPELGEYLVPNTPLRPSIAVAICWLRCFSGKGLSPIHDFLRGVRDGNDLATGSPALAYRNFLLNAVSRKRGIHSKQAFRTAILSVNNHLAGAFVKNCKIPGHVTFDGVEASRVADALGI